MKLGALWRGELPLNEAFWTWTVIIGLIVNASSTILFLALITVDRPWAALLIGYGFSVPYNIVAVVGVWRSATRYQGPSVHVYLARAASLLVGAILSLT
ncbi:hypothetical protein FHS85_004010 [Rhodoligotrophos appendicifer]|uniref:hypothetical protein n=1 Tax=Rhodoligotrophos appendicifer TaxID=987056 RepID=UPI00196185B3|nr:hypothetical protein [Rhodoligotrophos appendicifer]